MKKLLIILASLLIMTPAFAENKAVVQCLDNFSSDNPSAYFNARVLEEVEFDNGIKLEKDALIRGKVMQVVEAKRAKRDAYFVIKPVAYSTPSTKMVHRISQNDWEAKVVGYKPFDVKETAESAGVSVANFFVQGVSTVYYFGKGFIHPNDDNRLKSGVKEVYDNSFLSYIKEGNALQVRRGDSLELVFYHPDVPKWKFWERNR